MRLRDIFVFIGSFSAALGLSSFMHLRADELQSRDDMVLRMNGQCAAGAALRADSSRCERVGGHLRVEFAPRLPSPSGYGRPAASPAAVRTDSGTQSSGHLYLPGVDSGIDPFRR
jgi:hypothetical protein